MVDRVMALEEGTRLYLLAPIIRQRKGEYRKIFANLMKQGFQRLKVDGAFHEIADVPALDKKYKHDIDVVVDRIVVREDIATRLADSFETALKLSDGLASWSLQTSRWPRQIPQPGAAEQVAQRNPRAHNVLGKFACPVSGFTIDEVEPRLFSFNNPQGACPKCDGLGTELRFEADLWCRTSRCRCARAPSCRGPRPATPRPTTRKRWKRCASTMARP
jgi:excinuclease ABC subunit A